jgi:hypothetical protein
VTISAVAGKLVVRGAVLVSGRRADPPALLARALAALDRARGAAATRRPELSLALRRPRRAPKSS